MTPPDRDWRGGDIIGQSQGPPQSSHLSTCPAPPQHQLSCAWGDSWERTPPGRKQHTYISTHAHSHTHIAYRHAHHFPLNRILLPAPFLFLLSLSSSRDVRLLESVLDNTPAASSLSCVLALDAVWLLLSVLFLLCSIWYSCSCKVVAYMHKA